ncbi:MAG: DNA cytosine methyltransferase, partial [Microcystaceae cyanobacterium]
GFDVRAAVEVDPIHAAVHHFNFPNTVIIPQSVATLTAPMIRQQTQIGEQAIAVVFGGAPCQGFSLMGQRAFDDPRNFLVKEFVRLVKELQPDYFLFENVKGLTLGHHRQFLEELITEFAAINYQVGSPWRVLNASNYGVPQNRERLILLGAKQDLPLPVYPQAFTQAPNKKGNLPLAPTCREAIADLPEAEDYEALWTRDFVTTKKWGKASPYARQMRCLDSQGWFWGYQRQWHSNLLSASTRTDHSDISRRRFAETEPGTVEPISRFFRLPANGVANTLRAGTDSARGAFTSPRPIHYDRPRCITVREMARLHGFPDWFRFHSTKWHGARQIGNAVPPPLARALALEIIKVLEITPETPTTVLKLGNLELLQMVMTEAAQFWGNPVPIAQRDRHSGSKKRKQENI